MSPEAQHENNTPTAGVADVQDGLWLRGQFLSSKVQHGKPREGGEGNWPDRQVVTLLTGDRTVQVEYANDAAARAAIGDPQPTDEVMIPVGVRAAKSFVFYYGRARV